MKKNVLEYFEKTLLRHKEKIAVMDQNLEFTFDELETYSKRLSFMIRNNNEAIRKPIIVFLPKSADSIVAFLGVLYSGNIYAPVDVKSPDDRIKKIYENLENPLAITTYKYLEKLIDIGISVENIMLVEEAYDRSLVYDDRKSHLNELIDTDPIYIIHTSGSTGTPKGVVVSHKGVIDYIDWAIECFDISEKEIIGNQAPFYFDNSTLDIYLCLATGATLVIIPEEYFAFPVKLMEYITFKKINFIFWVPSVMINVANTKALDFVELDTLKKVLFAGEVMPNRHLNYWRNKLCGRLFANLYGPTEITVDCTYYIVKKDFEDYEKLPIGFPCSDSDILILNNENQRAKKNEIGELCVRGSSLALGYWNNKEKSDQVFIQNPLNEHYFDRIYRTGDLVYLNDCNEIIYVERSDSQIKHMGYRIELGEVENAVLSLSCMNNACVIYNEKKKEITMFYESDEDVGVGKIRAELAPLLLKYMIPTKMHRLEKLPLNKNGKIDRKRLADEWI